MTGFMGRQHKVTLHLTTLEGLQQFCTHHGAPEHRRAALGDARVANACASPETVAWCFDILRRNFEQGPTPQSAHHCGPKKPILGCAANETFFRGILYMQNDWEMVAIVHSGQNQHHLAHIPPDGLSFKANQPEMTTTMLGVYC